jgi:glycosyltransferase involved in cell wall biosynthesis
MIVKNEAKVIERCLASVRPLLDYVLVEDTGSSDGTQDIVRRWLEKEGIPGRVVEEPWRDFAYNRSHSLAELRNEPDVDYALIMDADDHAVINSGFDAAEFRQSLDLDAYTVELRQKTISYRRTQICSNRKRFFYKGVLHEYLECLDQPVTTGAAEGIYVISAREGARSQDPQKYAKDAALLERALQEETDEFLISRYTFYLAQSYRDAGRDELALANYLKRAELGYWPAERFYSLYQAGKIMDRLGRSADEVLGTYEKAWAMHPTRAESLHAAAALCRRLRRHSEGLNYAIRGLAFEAPKNCLFVEHWVYNYGLLDEAGVNGYWAGDYPLSVAACERLIRENRIPADQRQRVEENLAFGKAKLAEAAIPVAEQPLIFARAAARVQEDSSIILDAYSAAAERSDDPAAVLAEAARYCRVHKLFDQGYELAVRGLELIEARRREKSTRRALLDELGVNAYWIGKYLECSKACAALLRDPELSLDQRRRIRTNKKFADDKLLEQKSGIHATAGAAE